MSNLYNYHDDCVEEEGSNNDDDNDDDDYYVKINVGGTTFTTFKSTLTSKSSYFYSRFAFYNNNNNNNNNKKKDNKGTSSSQETTTTNNPLFLDHSPEDFQVLLDYMRYGYLHSSQISLKLLFLIDFLGIDDLIISMKCILIQNLYPKEVISALNSRHENDDNDDGVGVKSDHENGRTQQGKQYDDDGTTKSLSIETICCNLFESKFGCSSITSILQQQRRQQQQRGLKHHILLKNLRQDPSKVINNEFSTTTQRKEFAHLIISEMGIFTPQYPSNVTSTTALNPGDAGEEEEEEGRQQQQNYFDGQQNFGSFLLNGLRRQLNEAATGVIIAEATTATNSRRRMDIGSSNRSIRNNNDDATTATRRQRNEFADEENNVLLRHYNSIKDCHVHLATFLYVPRNANVMTTASRTQGRQQQQRQGGELEGDDGGIIRRTTTATNNVSVARDPAGGGAVASTMSTATTNMQQQQQQVPRLVGVLDCPSFLDGLNRLHQLGFTKIEKGYNHIEDHSFATAYLHPIYDHCWFSRPRGRRQQQQPQKVATSQVVGTQRHEQDINSFDFLDGEGEYVFSSSIIFDDDDDDSNDMGHRANEERNIANNNDGGSEERRQFAALINTGLDKDNKCNAFVLADVGRRPGQVGGSNNNGNIDNDQYYYYLQFVDVYGNTGDRLQTNLTKISFENNDHELLWWLDENGYTKEETKISQIYEKIYQRGFKIGKGWRDDRVKKISVTVFSRKLII